MPWTPTQQFHPWPFDKEAELEAVIAEAKSALFGESRIYLDGWKLIGERGKTQNIPDGYLLDLSSPRKPVLYLVEVARAGLSGRWTVGASGCPSLQMGAIAMEMTGRARVAFSRLRVPGRFFPRKI